METKRRSLAKMVTWRLIALMTTTLITWLFMGEVLGSIEISLTINAVQMVEHYIHERLWDGIKWQVILCRCETEVTDMVHHVQDRFAGRRS